MAQTSERKIRPITTNRKAFYEYEVISRFEAGLMLAGTEVKSIRAGKLNMLDAYASFPNKKSNELYLYNLHISTYEFGNRENHEPNAKRKLLLNAAELTRIRTGIEEKGLTVVPLSMYFSGPYIKIEIALVRGKQSHDKRAAIKDKDIKKSLREARL